jgi:hypothetical protein
MNRNGLRIGGSTQGGFSTIATAAALAFAVNAAFGVVLMSGSTAGQRMYRTWDKETSAMIASAAQRKACEKG